MADKKVTRGHGRTVPPKRISADISSIEAQLDTYPDLPNATKTWPQWAKMTRPEKLLHLASEGINAAQNELADSE